MIMIGELSIMICFKKVEINDKKWIAPLLAAADLRACHYNFTNLFVWSEIYKYRVAQVEDLLLVKGQDLAGTRFYYHPVGKSDPKPVIKEIVKDASNSGDKIVLLGISTENIAVINSLFPGKFGYTERQDNFDYVYLLDKLVTLTGDKLQSKRNHINHFKKHKLWSFEPISSENLAECWEMNIEWCKVHGCMYDDRLANEKWAVRRCFDYFNELGLEGGALRSDGRVIAYTIGDKLNSDTYDIHIEKAFNEILGAYQMINHEFAALIQKNHPGLIYVNREEDMGQDGLRKAKLSYHPIKMEEKYWGKFTGLKSV